MNIGLILDEIFLALINPEDSVTLYAELQRVLGCDRQYLLRKLFSCDSEFSQGSFERAHFHYKLLPLMLGKRVTLLKVRLDLIFRV